MIWYKYEAGYKDTAGNENHYIIESGAKFTQRRREFTNECKRNGWELLYFLQVGQRDLK